MNLMPTLALLVSLLGIIVAVGLLTFAAVFVFCAWRRTSAVYMETIRDLARVANYAAAGLAASSTGVSGGETPQEYLARLSSQMSEEAEAHEGLESAEKVAEQPGTEFVAGS